MTYKPVPYQRDEMLREIMNDPEARAIYEATKLQIELSMKLKKARLKRDMTQDDVAVIMHTKKPTISRLEGCDDVKNFPSLFTLVKFASAIGYTLNIKLSPDKKNLSDKYKNITAMDFKRKKLSKFSSKEARGK